jgi:hypothetical protein
MPNYDHRAEFEALISSSVRDALLACKVQRIAFSDL